MLFGCSTFAETKRLNFVKNNAVRDCSNLKAGQKQMCLEVIENRLVNYEKYVKRHDKYMKALEKAHKEQAAVSKNFEKKKLDKKNLALMRKKNSAKLKAIERYAQKEYVERQKAEINLYQAMAGTSSIFIGKRAKTQYVCKVRDTGRIDCVSLAVLLSNYNTQTANTIIRDINRIHEVYELDFSRALLFECGPGKWTNMAVSEPDLANFSGFLEDSGFESMMNNCSKYDDFLTNDRAESLMASGGFSGITGFDPLGLMSICGMEISGDSAQEFIDDAMDYAEEMRQYCETTMAETMMTTLENADLPNKEEGDGKKIATATEISQNGDGTETVATVDGDGNMITETRDSTQDYDSITVNYQDGSSGTTKIYSDGSTNTMNRDPNGDATMITTQPVDGGTQVTTMDPEGNVTEEFFPDLAPIPTPTKLPNFFQSFQSACAGEPCSSCVDFMEFYPDLEFACATGSAGNARECGNYAQTADCCSNENAYPADPRLVMPNPQGDFFCAGGADLDLVDGMCEAQCSVAYSEDCYSNCADLAGRGLQFDFNLLDAICIYARSEACFSKGGSIPLPDYGGSPFRPSPIPTPELVGAAAAELNPGLIRDYGIESGAGMILENIIIPIVPEMR
jgi:hypothetical protein